MASHTGFSVGNLGEAKDAITFTPITGLVNDGMVNDVIPEMINDFSALEALRAAVFGTGPGNPTTIEIHTLLESDDKLKDSVKILQYDDDSAGEPSGDYILNDANTNWSTLHKTYKTTIDTLSGNEEQEKESVTEEESLALPSVYNICTTDISLSREVGNAEAIHLFMNTVPTTEFSRCVPYLDVQFYGPVRSGEVDSDGVPSLYRFILGDEEFKGSPWANTSNRLEMPDASEDTSETAEKAKVRNVSGMEVFLSPQTLVNADERTTASRMGGFHGLTNGVVDPFRPFMSLNDLTLNIAPKVNSIIFSDGTLSFTLHDKSRLPEISSLVSPKNMGQVYMTITYGWSHPDGEGTADITVGKFLDSLKTTETFIISNSSYTFTPSGEVNITLSIAASGARQVLETGKVMDDVCMSDARSLEELEEMIVLIRDSLPEKVQGVPTTKVKDQFESAGKGAGIFTSELGRRGLRELIATAKNADIDPDDAVTKLEEMVDSDKLTEMESNRKSIHDLWKKKLTSVIVNPDPFLVWDTCWGSDLPPAGYRHKKGLEEPATIARYLQKEGGATPGDRDLMRRKYCSFGKLFNAYVVAPLLYSPNFPDFDEVQVHWGVLNDRASYLKNMNISAVPVKTSDFVEIMQEVKNAQGPNIGIYDFIGMIQNAFFDNQAWEAYGFNKSGSDTEREINEETGLYDYNEAEDTSAAHTRRLAVLKDAYQGSGPFDFKQPLIKVQFEAPPIEPLDPNESEVGGGGATKQTKILKIFIEDEKSMSYSGAVDLMQRVFEHYIPAALTTEPEDESKVSADRSRRVNNSRAANFAQDMGLMTTTGGRLTFAGGQAYKSILKAFAPSVEIGSSNSAVFAASVQNMAGSGNLRDVHMLKGASPASQSVEEEIMPLTMMPQQMTLTLPGMPLLAPLVTMFIDMKTGTDIDALYSIQSVSHNVAAGKFVTTANLFYTGGYAVFRTLAQRLGDFASHMSDTVGKDLVIEVDKHLAASEESFEDLSDAKKANIQKLNAQLRLEGVPPLSENSSPEADAPDSAAVGAAKKERVATLRSFKPKEVVELIKRHLGLAVKYAKMTENEKLSDLLKEQAEKNLEKQKTIALDHIDAMLAHIDALYAGDEDDSRKNNMIAQLEEYKAKLG